MPTTEQAQAAACPDAVAAATVLQLPPVVRDLWKAQQALAKHYAHTGLRFTLDGRLVGDIAEALALQHFDLVVPEERTPGVDALTKSGKTVQIKASGGSKSGPAFTPGKGIAEFLLFFHIDFAGGVASLVYNGPEVPVRALLPAKWEGTKVVKLSEIRALASGVAPEDALPLNLASRTGKNEEVTPAFDHASKTAGNVAVETRGSQGNPRQKHDPAL